MAKMSKMTKKPDFWPTWPLFWPKSRKWRKMWNLSICQLYTAQESWLLTGMKNMKMGVQKVEITVFSMFWKMDTQDQIWSSANYIQPKNRSKSRFLQKRENRKKTAKSRFESTPRPANFELSHFFRVFQKCQKSHFASNLTLELAGPKSILIACDKNDTVDPKIQWENNFWRGVSRNDQKVIKKWHFFGHPVLRFRWHLLGKWPKNDPKKGSKKWPKKGSLGGGPKRVKNSPFLGFFANVQNLSDGSFLTLGLAGRCSNLILRFKLTYAISKVVPKWPKNGQKWPKKGSFLTLFLDPCSQI